MHKQSGLFETFISYKQQLTRAIRGIVGVHDIEDILQETFVRSYQAEQKQEIKHERTYMLRTAQNLALNHVSQSAQKLNTSIEEIDGDLPELNTPDIENQFESKERFLHFCRAADSLLLLV